MKNLIIITLLFFSTTYHLQAQTTVYEALLKSYVSNTGDVDYKGFRKSKAVLNVYLDELEKTIPGKTWSSNQAKAFWMNVYNAYSIKLILESYPLKEITAIKRNGKNAWKIPFAKVGGATYSLDYIEHKILRRWHDDPRIHVGLNAGSKSGPKFANYIYTEKNVDQKLETSMKNFINDTTKNKVSNNKLEISKIFDWYKEDFTYKTTIIEYINKYATVKANDDAVVTFLEYDWALNDQK